MRIVVGVALVLLHVVAPQRAVAQCRADFDGSGAVEINELIAAVNEALGTCGGAATPTPSVTPAADACPWQFDDAVSPSDSFCRYAGTGDSNCTEPYAAETAWTTRGTEVFGVIIAAQGVLAIVAQRTSPTAAAVESVAFGPDFYDLFDTSGTLTLPSPGAAQFSMQGLINECGTLVLDAAFIGLANPVDTTTASASSAVLGVGPAPAPATARADARARLRALLAAMR